MTRHKPVQQRSRERVDQILQTSLDLISEAGIEAVSTRTISERSGIPVATIYRYFADRGAILAALTNRELAVIDGNVLERIAALERVTLASLIETVVIGHLDHFQRFPRAARYWFEARESPAIRDLIHRRYEELGRWLGHAARASGLLIDDTPDFGPELLVWALDRAFEFAFWGERDAALQRRIMEEALAMAVNHASLYATETGRTGVSRDEFLASLGGGLPDAGAFSSET